MISISDRHLVLQPKLNSSLRLLRLPLLSAYICPICDGVIYAVVRLEPGQEHPHLGLYHESLNGNLMSYVARPLTPVNGERGIAYIESGHRKQGRLDEVGRFTTGRCAAVKVILEADPLRRALQFLRTMSQVYALPNWMNAGGKTGRTFSEVMDALEKHPDLVPVLNEFIRLRPRVVALDEVGDGPPALVIRHSGWDQQCFVDPCKAILNQAFDRDAVPA